MAIDTVDNGMLNVTFHKSPNSIKEGRDCHGSHDSYIDSLGVWALRLNELMDQYL